MVREKHKLDAEDPKLSKKTTQKCPRLTVPSKFPVIIGTLSSSVVCLGTTPQQEIFNSLTKKLKNKAMLIVHIIEAAVNTL